jgi:hypothetical protein
MANQLHSILTQALSGNEMPAGSRRKKIESDIPSLSSIWVAASGKEYAVFVSKGEHFSDVINDGVRQARRHKLEPLIVATDYLDIKGIRPHYVGLRPHLIANIAGMPTFINAPKFRRRQVKAQLSPTRIPLSLLDGLKRPQSLPDYVRRALTTARAKYRKLIALGQSNNDDAEETILLAYAKQVLDGMGLRSDKISQTHMIRMLEGGGHGARRDHFFHSFQNYFLGLKVVDQHSGLFSAFSTDCGLHWAIDPHGVWFLTVMWHDVGYALQNVAKTLDMAVGFSVADESAINLKREFLEQPKTQEGLKRICHLQARLLNPGSAPTAWMLPDISTNIGKRGNDIVETVRQNVIKSHGAISAIRLYRAYKDDLDEMIEPNHRDLLLQSVLLAAASMPFHDFWYREQMRSACGGCMINTKNLPFAALLAFIDSIQDDRRELEQMIESAVTLKGLAVNNGIVSAIVDQDAVSSGSFLDKVLEARDLACSLDNETGFLGFEYPPWMVG